MNKNVLKSNEERRKPFRFPGFYSKAVHLRSPNNIQSPRIVPAFSLQALRQKNVQVQQFQSTHIPKTYPIGKSAFRRYYQRGDFPICLEFDTYGPKISWKVNLSDIDYNYYLPLFFDGLSEVEHPYHFFAQQGIRDLILHNPKKVIPLIPQIVLPIKNALNTRNKIIAASTLKIIQLLVTNAEPIGETLVPFYRQILPPLNIYKNMYVSTGDDIDYAQQKKENLGELVQETLEMLETYGGRNAFINIKYIIPTYESCVRNM